MFIAKSKRLAVLFMIAVTLFVVISCAAFNVIELGHDCTGEDCPVCYCVNLCENTLRQLTLVSSQVLFAYVNIFAVLIFCSYVTLCESHKTLITLKVKLSN